MNPPGNIASIPGKPAKSGIFSPPPPPPYDDDMPTTISPDDLESTLVYICQHYRYLSPEQKGRLRALVDPPRKARPEKTVYDAGFNVGKEVEAQIVAVRAVRATVMEGIDIKKGVSSREAKEVISSGSTLLTTLMKFHSKVVNMDRMRMLEESVVEVLQEQNPKLRKAVMAAMEKRLADTPNG